MNRFIARVNYVGRVPELTAVRRDRFLRAAISCFSRYGYRRTSMEAIAESAEVSRPALYQYYRNKEEIFRDAVKWGLEDLAARASREASKPGEVAPRLSAVLSVVLMMHFPRDGARFPAELVDETRARAGDHWRAFEHSMIDTLVTVLHAAGAAATSLDDAAHVLFYGAKGIAMQLDDRREAARRLEHLTHAVTYGTPGLR
ncbi:helix-turn-helix domain-containing protein [Actinoplanes sp. NPDC051861]|uniref:TetR/AcrR family transcriptional regulator n=1 Tax=Actinoplanes sp. NPDC051861 TaxID=3155170 RepID=UPI00344AE3CB